MQRVLVIGCSGSGKTTLARCLAAKHGLHYISLDAEFWQPGWVGTPDEVFIPRVEQLCQLEHWVMDGTYSRTLALRLEHADTVIWLEIPRYVCITRVMWRLATSCGRIRPEMAPGCPEHFDWGFLRYIWHYHRRHHAQHLGMLTEWLGHTPISGKWLRSLDRRRAIIWWPYMRLHALPQQPREMP